MGDLFCIFQRPAWGRSLVQLGTVLFGCWGLVRPGWSQTADSFNPGVTGLPASVYALSVQLDGKVLLGGNFTTLARSNRYYLGRVTADGLLDTPFNAMDSSGSTVSCFSVQPDGRILVGGNFKSIDGLSRNYLARLLPDGNLDAGFNASADGGVNALAVQPDGKILVGGAFTHLDGQPGAHLGRLEPDGTLDTNFNASLDGAVNSLALQPDGEVLIGGAFTNVDGQTIGRLARLNADGTLDTNFVGSVDGLRVNALALQPDGKILVGGAFNVLDSQNQTNLGRLNPDGSLDTVFNPACTNGGVNSIVLQADGKFIVGGGFSSLWGQSVTNLGRLNADGTLDSSFSTSAGLIYGLALQADGKLLVGGMFSQLAGQSRANLGRLNNTDPATDSLTYDSSTVTWLRGGTAPDVWRTTFEASNDGTNWVSLGAGTRVAGGWQVTGLSLSSNVNVRATGFVVGGYGDASSWPVQAMAGPPLIIAQPESQVVSTGKTAVLSVSASGTLPLSYQWQENGTNLPGATGSTLTITNAAAGNVGSYAVVVSNAAGTVVSSSVSLALAASVGTDSFAPTVSGLTVRTLAVQPDGKVLLAPSSSLNGGTSAYLVRVNADGSADASFYSSPSGANNLITALAVQEDSKILVGGFFTTFNGQPCASLCRLQADGTLDTSFTAATGGHVYCLVLQPDGKIVIGGDFNTVDGQPHVGLARLNADGTLDTGFNPPAVGPVYCLAIQSDDSLLVGGAVSLSQTSHPGIERVLPDGTLDATFDPSLNGTVYSVAVQADGKIVFGGNVASLTGQWAKDIGRLNPDGTIDTAFNPGADAQVITVALQADGKILAGGSFSQLGGHSDRYLGRLNPDGTLDATFNVLNVGAGVQLLTLQPDGKVLVCGGFTALGLPSRRYVARLNNTQPAAQTLAIAGAQLVWDRSATAPEVWRASFAATTNGVDWLNLGDGIRIPGGWTLNASALPAGATVRAHGFIVNSGFSDWFAESWLFQQQLAILTTDGNFGVRSGSFGFNIVGAPGQAAVIETSTDLLNWAPLRTNAIASGPSYFTDPSWTNYPTRYYRLRSP